MKLDRKYKALLIVGFCSLMMLAAWFIQSAGKKTQENFYSYSNKKGDSEWFRYRAIRKKLFTLNQGWKRSSHRPNPKSRNDIEIPIKEAVAIQINEIKRIYDEEILGKLSEANRIYEEYQQNLYRESEIIESEKIKEAKIKLEADLASKKEWQRQILKNYHQEIERKHQYTLINLELQKKMLAFNSMDLNKQQEEVERIDNEIAIIREEIKKKMDERGDELDQEFTLYQNRRTAGYQRELRGFHKTKQQKIESELNRFREELMKEFRDWNDQRRTDVEEAIKLRHSQQ